MGSCFSKKKEPSPQSNPIQNDPQTEKVENDRKEEAENSPAFVPTQNKMTAIPTAEEKDNKKEEELPNKKTHPDEHQIGGGGTAATAEELRPAPASTSSCTKEELDAILIQCGHLSRSTSGNATSRRKYSGWKRSYDFDSEKGRDGDDEWDKPASRPSPHRRTPTREKERGRRVSRSPVRRSDGPPSSGSAADKTKHPGKMVSVPAREKSGGITEAGRLSSKRASSPAVTNKRGSSSSPRSRSPANTTKVFNQNTLNHTSHPRSLGRSSEQSPCRRNPMAEIDENTLKPEQQQKGSNKLHKSRDEEGKAIKETSQISNSDQKISGAVEISNGNRVNQAISEQQLESEIVEEAAEVKGVPLKSTARTRSSRRASRDMDHNQGLNPETVFSPTSYNSALLEDIHNYHQQSNTASSLPACLSKASSILAAVADLSSFSENKGYEAEGSKNSGNGRFRRGLVKSEAFDDLIEPSLHKYVTVRGKRGGEMEAQESAGSNSFVGQPWDSPWEPNSVESSDRYWTSQSHNSEEVEEGQGQPNSSCSRRLPVNSGLGEED